MKNSNEVSVFVIKLVMNFSSCNVFPFNRLLVTYTTVDIVFPETGQQLTGGTTGDGVIFFSILKQPF